MNKKLQNIKAIKQMLEGNHKFQTKKTTGFSDAKAKAEKSKKRAVGDIWEEIDPISGTVTIVEQREGFRIRKSKNSEVMQEVRDYIRSFPNCQKETCTCVKPHPLDEKMRKLNGMCFDCTIEFEHELKKQGKFDEYARDKMRKNALAWLAQAEQEVELLKQIYTQASTAVINADGMTEKIDAQMTPEEFAEKVEKSFAEYKENFLKKLNGEINEDDTTEDKE